MNIKCTQNMFKSADGSSAITYYIFQPEETELRGIVQISHGMCEYFSRYTPFAKYLCSLGFIVCGNDHLGHGCSAQKAADLGFFGTHNGWQYLIDDMKELTSIMQSRYPDLPYFVFGHSMGSLIARLYLKDCGEKLKGAILCGTVGPHPLGRSAMRMANSVVHSRGTTYRSAFLYRMAFQTYNRKIANPQSSFDWLTRDHRTVALFQSDEKCNFIFTSAGFRDLFTLVAYANHSRCFKSSPRDLPLLFISGDMDPVGNYGEGVRQTANLYRGAGVRDVDVIFYKGARHELLNEINSHEVFGDISKWLESHLLPAEAPEAEAVPEQPNSAS